MPNGEFSKVRRCLNLSYNLLSCKIITVKDVILNATATEATSFATVARPLRTIGTHPSHWCRRARSCWQTSAAVWHSPMAANAGTIADGSATMEYVG